MDVDLSGTESTPRASSSRSKPLNIPPEPSSLHDVVLDYISHMGYIQTAQKLAQTKPSNGHGGGDVEMGDEVPSSSNGAGRAGFDEDALLSIERRYDIINHILNGAIAKAIEALNTHYPVVLTLSPDSTTFSSSSGSNGHANGSGGGSADFASLVASNSFAPCSPTNGSSTNRNGHNHNHTQSGVTPNARQINTPSKPNVNANVNVNTTTTTEPTNNAIPTFHESLYPPHVLLNLHIQDFIESFRLLNPDSSPSSSMASSMASLHASQSLSMSMSFMNGGSNGGGAGSLQQALAAAGGLHAEAGRLEPSDRAVYVREITEAGALLAYTDPESSPVGGFLKQERRIELARQVNRAILHSQGLSTQSLLEQFARRTIATYSILDQRNIDAKPPWTGTEGPERQQLAKWWKTHSKRFRLADFVIQGFS